MKACLLLLSLVLASALDYGTLNDWGASSACLNGNPWGQQHYSFQSPVMVMNSGCLPYGLFQLSMLGITSQTWAADATTGGLSRDYTGAQLRLDGNRWQSTKVIFRYKAEHRLYSDNLADITKSALDSTQADLEMQIIMQSSSDSLTPNTAGVLSFLIKADKDSSTALALSSLNVISSSDTTPTLTVNLDQVANAINNKISQGLFLNMFTYNGSLTYPPCDKATWFIYGTHLYTSQTNINNIATAITNQASTIGTLNQTFNSRPFMAKPGLQAGAGWGPQVTARLCFSGYFDIYLNWNYGLWFGTVIVTCFFIVTLSTGDKPITDIEYKEEVKTIIPWVSLYKVGNELHTRKTRASLLLTTMTMHALFSSVWYLKLANPTDPVNIIVYAIYSMLVNQPIVFFHGCMLRGYYTAKREFLKTKEEKWNQKSQNRLFAFYISLFVIIVVGWPFCTWNMNELHPERNQTSSNYWVASFFVGLALEWFVIDVLWALLAYKVNWIRNLMRNKGYFYDDLCHATYIDYLKLE